MKTSVKFSPVNTSQRKNLDMRAGDTVRVTVKIKEKDKIRLQTFEGLVLAKKHGKEPGATFTVRKVASGVGVERIFPLYSPAIEKIEVVKRTKARRSKLYYIREKAAKEIRRKMRTLRTGVTTEVPLEEMQEEIIADATDTAENTEEKADKKTEEQKEAAAA
ncbi:50S ribosomal protein L19 [bacterium]|nr:50S ribosomal protein L19 [bacterium]